MIYDMSDELYDSASIAEKQIFNKMADSPLDFYLTGSRYMDVHTSTSDWDFLVQASLPNIEALKALGFVVVGEPNEVEREYTDGFTVCFLECGSIQIQCITTLKGKLRARDIVRDHMLAGHTNMPSDVRVDFWNKLITVANIALTWESAWPGKNKEDEFNDIF